MVFSHLTGTSFRSLGEKYNINPSTAYRRVVSTLRDLPHCADITRKYCNKFCGILLVDGKYIKVKGYERKIPVIYGIDYLTHDIPTYILSYAENYQTCLSFFNSLKLLNYPLQAVVSDDNINIYQAAQRVYPAVLSQICTNHYKESIRTNLDLTTNTFYTPFMKEVEILFGKRRSQSEFNSLALKILKNFSNDPRLVSVMLDIERRLEQLTAYTKLKNVPQTTNLIESYNSHLQGRLETIKGFESFKHAKVWLNAYFINRRLKKFTDCTNQFRKLNGTASIQHTLKNPNNFNHLLSLIR